MCHWTMSSKESRTREEANGKKNSSNKMSNRWKVRAERKHCNVYWTSVYIDESCLRWLLTMTVGHYSCFNWHAWLSLRSKALALDTTFSNGTDTDKKGGGWEERDREWTNGIKPNKKEEKICFNYKFIKKISFNLYIVTNDIKPKRAFLHKNTTLYKTNFNTLYLVFYYVHIIFI